MSTSLLYHALGLKGYEYQKTEYLNGTIFFHVQKQEAYQYCTNCRSRAVVLAGRVERMWYSLPIGLKPTLIVAHLHRLECERCGVTHLESLEVADPRRSYIRAFARYVVEMARYMTKAAIAIILKFVSWNTIKDIIKTDLKRRLKRRKLNRVRRIAIDEVAVKKGHRYLTTVVDLDTGEVIYCVEGKDAECLQPFFLKIKRSRKTRLEAIAVDMSKAYLKAIELYAPPGVKVIHDRYHLVANMNAVLDEIRRDEYREKQGPEKAVIKGSRYLLLSAWENVAADQTKRSRLEALLALNETLHKAHLLKEDLRFFWEQDSRGQAEAFISTWLKEARSVNNVHLTAIADTVETHLAGILNYYDHPITTGPLEETTTRSRSSNEQLTDSGTWSTSNSGSCSFGMPRSLWSAQVEPVIYAKRGRTTFLGGAGGIFGCGRGGGRSAQQVAHPSGARSCGGACRPWSGRKHRQEGTGT